MFKVVLLRHGESTWNKENRFTGWTDVDLSAHGNEEAMQAGEVLRAEGFVFDVAYTSVLKRAIRTLWHALDALDLMWIPTIKAWQLNERHYGALQGLNKAETAAQFGDEQVLIWRRSYDTPPPALAPDDERYPGRDPRYAALRKRAAAAHRIAQGDCGTRHPVLARRRSRRISGRVSACSSPRTATACARWSSISTTWAKRRSSTSTSRPACRWSTSWTTTLKPIQHYYLGDPDEIAKAAAAVAAQGKAK